MKYKNIIYIPFSSYRVLVMIRQQVSICPVGLFRCHRGGALEPGLLARVEKNVKGPCIRLHIQFLAACGQRGAAQLSLPWISAAASVFYEGIILMGQPL